MRGGIHNPAQCVCGCMCVFMSVLPREMIIYLQMPPTKSHDPLLWGLDEREVKRLREERQNLRDGDVWIL